MTIWIDAQLSPALVNWLAERFGVLAHHLRDMNLVHATDPQVFGRARVAGSVILTKDRDFVDLVQRHGAPPQVLCLTCGNTSNAALFRVLDSTLAAAMRLLESGEILVEIRG